MDLERCARQGDARIPDLLGDHHSPCAVYRADVSGRFHRHQSHLSFSMARRRAGREGLLLAEQRFRSGCYSRRAPPAEDVALLHQAFIHALYRYS